MYLGNSSDFPPEVSVIQDPVASRTALSVLVEECQGLSGLWAAVTRWQHDHTQRHVSHSRPWKTLSWGRTEDRKIAFDFLDASKLSKMAVSEYSLTGDVLCQTQHLQVTSYC